MKRGIIRPEEVSTAVGGAGGRPRLVDPITGTQPEPLELEHSKPAAALWCPDFAAPRLAAPEAQQELQPLCGGIASFDHSSLSEDLSRARERIAELRAPLVFAPQPSALPEPDQLPVRTVYASPPVLNTSGADAATGRRDAQETPAGQPDAKRLCPQGSASTSAGVDVVESPATARAAAAAAAPGPIWVYKDGVVTQVNGQHQEGASTASFLPQLGTAIEAGTTAEPPADTGGSGVSGPPLPAGWIRVPHEGEYYYWNTSTGEVSWDHPAGPRAKPEKPVFTEEHKVLLSDLGRLIGRQGMNLKIIKASIGATVNVPRAKGKAKGKGKDAKVGKGDGKNKGAELVRGAGTGDTPISDDQFATVVITADTAHAARGGKRCIEVMLGYGRSVDRALGDLGVEVKLPSMQEELKSAEKGSKSKDELDPMDPASYSEAPQGDWGRGLAKPGAQGRSGGPPQLPRDAKQANAERF